MKIEKINLAAINNNEQLKKAELDKVLVDFEAMMVSQFYEQVVEDLEPDPLTGGGYTEKIYRSFLFGELAKISAKSRGAFLTKSIQDKLYEKYAKAQK